MLKPQPISQIQPMELGHPADSSGVRKFGSRGWQQLILPPHPLCKIPKPHAAKSGARPWPLPPNKARSGLGHAPFSCTAGSELGQAPFSPCDFFPLTHCQIGPTSPIWPIKGPGISLPAHEAKRLSTTDLNCAPNAAKVFWSLACINIKFS